MQGVLADTGPLYAAVDPDDRYHARAQEQLRTLEDENRSVVLAYPTLLEAYTLILHRLGGPTAARWLDDIRAGTASLNPTTEDYLAALGLVKRFPDQTITLFDATVAALAMRLSLPVWTYDHHFDTMRSSVWRD
jgi:predicted nucleic acid-binding protein